MLVSKRADISPINSKFKKLIKVEDGTTTFKDITFATTASQKTSPTNSHNKERIETNSTGRQDTKNKRRKLVLFLKDVRPGMEMNVRLTNSTTL